MGLKGSKVFLEGFLEGCSQKGFAEGSLKRVHSRCLVAVIKENLSPREVIRTRRHKNSSLQSTTLRRAP